MSYDIVHNGGEVGRVRVEDTPTIILPAEREGHPHRKYAYIRNIHPTNTVWLAIGSVPEVDHGIPLAPGEHYTIDRTNLTAAAVNGVCEGTKHAHVSTQVGR